MMKNILILISITLITTTVCYAKEPRTVEAYRHHMQLDLQHNKDFDHTLRHILYLNGIGDGYVTINKRRRANNQSPLYCQQESRALHGIDYKRLLEEMIKKPITGHLAVSEALLLALEQEFPCPSPTSK